VVNAIKEFPYIALQSVTRTSAIARNFPNHPLHPSHSFMRPPANPAGKRIGNKRWFKYSIQNLKNGMVHHPIAHRRFVNMPSLWIRNIKTIIRPMPICFVFERMVQFENMLFQFPIKTQNIRLVSFSLPEFFPCLKQVFRRNDFSKQISVMLH